MYSIVYYFLSKKRLNLSSETIEMMGGPNKCGSMLMAQHEMIVLENDHHKEQSIKFLAYCLFAGLIFLGFLWSTF